MLAAPSNFAAEFYFGTFPFSLIIRGLWRALGNSEIYWTIRAYGGGSEESYIGLLRNSNLWSTFITQKVDDQKGLAVQWVTFSLLRKIRELKKNSSPGSPQPKLLTLNPN